MHNSNKRNNKYNNIEGSSSQILQIACAQMRQTAWSIKVSCAQMRQIACNIKKKIQRQNAANSMQHGRFSSKMLQITRKMKGSSSKMLQIACSMEGKWQDRCRGRKQNRSGKKIPGAGEKKSPARFGTVIYLYVFLLCGMTIQNNLW